MKEKSITIHGINKDLDRKIQEKSREYNLRQNKTVKKILEDSLIEKKILRAREFEEFLGIWTKEEAEEFEKSIEDDERIDEEDWK